MEKLFSNFKLKNLNLKNRVVVPPLVMDYGTEDGYVTDRVIEHFNNLSKGEPGLIVQEATCVSKTGKLSKKQLGIWSDDHVSGLKRVVDTVHNNGVPIIVQIHHAGVVGIDNDKVCPSNYSFNRADEITTGRELTLADIESIQNQFVQATLRAYNAGYDGVELHGCHSYLISQFLNNRVNTRVDKYGTNRELFATEIVEKIKNVVPDSFIVGIRIAAFEPSLAEGIENCIALEKAGIDFLDISYGFFSEQEITVPSDFKYSEPVYGAMKIKETVNIPVFAVCKIRTSEEANGVLKDTGVDLVNIGRGYLVNSNWALDAKAGRDTGKCHWCTKCHWRGQVPKCIGREKYLKGA